MTKKELADLIAENEKDTDYAMEIILKQIKPGFVTVALHAELENVKKEIEKMKEEGYISSPNGMDHACWKPEIDYKMYNKANRLLYERNRLLHMLYHG